MRLRDLTRATSMTLALMTLALTASADVSAAQSFVQRDHGLIQRLIEQNAPASEVTKAIDGMVDYTEVAQRALGKPCPITVPTCTNHWDGLSDAQKTEVADLFKGLVEKKYRENAYKTRNFDVTYRGTKEQAADLSKVRTEAKNRTKPREPAYQVDYIVRSRGDAYKVVDIVTEGSVLTKNYYDQSHKMLTTQGQGYPYFVKKLRDKVTK